MLSGPDGLEQGPLVVAGGPPPSSLGSGRRRTALHGRRAVAVSAASSVALLGFLAALFFFAPGSEQVRRTFFNLSDAKTGFFGDSRGGIFSEAGALVLNIELFLIAEALILVLAMVIAMIRQLRGPVTFPLRMLAIAYTDFFRGVPLILVIYAIGFGVPALNLAGISTQATVVYGEIALVLSYSAYVSEVYRAGIESVHPSQVAAARSLGLSQWQAMRSVVVPQAVRRVIPPLLNDFISLQKDTALVAVLGVIEVNRAAGILSSTDFNYTGYTVAALLFLLLTVPLARFTDWLIARDRRRRQSGSPT
ncbi:MAG TPA: amino acid ABC transporter permease [Candidatus Dormibacteraeota bacterium]